MGLRSRARFIGNIDGAGRARAIRVQRRPSLQSLPSWMGALGTDDANPAAGQTSQQASDIWLLTRQRSEVEDDRAAVKERRRAFDLGVERIDPIFHGRLRRKH